MRELPAGRRAPETRAQELALVDELLGEPVEEAVEQLLVETRLLGARLPADRHEVVEGVAFVFEAAPVKILEPRHTADRAFHCVTAPVQTVDDPLQHAHVLAEPGPEEVAVVVTAKPVDAEDARR